MSNIPSDLKYTRSHEWVRVELDGSLTVGITDHAQEALGDIVFLELPASGSDVEAKEACGVIESVKAASDIYAPASGKVLGANPEAQDSPESVNADAYAAWLFKLQPIAVPTDLLSAAEYEKFVAEG